MRVEGLEFKEEVEIARVSGISEEGSIGDAVDGGDAGEELVFPLDFYAAVHFWIAISQSAHIQPVAAVSHQSHVYDILEVFVGGCQFVDDLRICQRILLC